MAQTALLSSSNGRAWTL